MSVIGSFVVPHPPLIVHEVGRGDELKVSDTIDSYKKIASEIAELKPDTIIISSPHAKAYSDYFCLLGDEKLTGSFSNFGASSVSFEEKNDVELVKLIEEISLGRNFPCGRVEDELDHGSLVPLYFIKEEYKDFNIVVLGLSGLGLIEHYRLGMIISDAVNRLHRKVVYVASGDLSHKLQEDGPYGFASEGVEYDSQIMDVFKTCSFDKLLEFDNTFLNKASECGHRSFTIMAGLFDGLNVSSNVYSHEDITGVGYGVCSFRPGSNNDNRKYLDKYFNNLKSKIEKDIENSDDYVKIARLAINEFVMNKEYIQVPKDISSDLINKQAGVFVSIHKYGLLRGCIGTISPVQDNIALEIINNAVSACSSDNRFNPVTRDELPWLEISVDVLGEAEDIDNKNMLDPKKYGVIVSSGYKRGLLLPNLDGIDDVDTQISIALRKAGINEFDDYSLQRFEVVRHY